MFREDRIPLQIYSSSEPPGQIARLSYHCAQFDLDYAGLTLLEFGGLVRELGLPLREALREGRS